MINETIETVKSPKSKKKHKVPEPICLFEEPKFVKAKSLTLKQDDMDVCDAPTEPDMN